MVCGIKYYYDHVNMQCDRMLGKMETDDFDTELSG